MCFLADGNALLLLLAPMFKRFVGGDGDFIDRWTLS